VSKCEHRQSHYDFLYTVSKKISCWVSLLYRNNLLANVCFSCDPNFLLLHISFLHCMDLQPYSHDHYSKISRTIGASRNKWIIVVFLQCMLKRKITFRSRKHFFTPYPSLSPYSQTDKMTDRGTNTLAARGLEELFFPLCYCVSFLVVAGNSFRCYLPTIPVVPLCLFLVGAGNSFGLHRSVCWLWQEIVLGVTYLSTIQVVPLCQFFGCSGK
jgi:hypothetical protein